MQHGPRVERRSPGQAVSGLLQASPQWGHGASQDNHPARPQLSMPRAGVRHPNNLGALCFKGLQNPTWHNLVKYGVAAVDACKQPSRSEPHVEATAALQAQEVAVIASRALHCATQGADGPLAVQAAPPSTPLWKVWLYTVSKTTRRPMRCSAVTMALYSLILRQPSVRGKGSRAGCSKQPAWVPGACMALAPAWWCSQGCVPSRPEADYCAPGQTLPRMRSLQPLLPLHARPRCSRGASAAPAGLVGLHVQLQ